jgi:hypothetical protein
MSLTYHTEVTRFLPAVSVHRQRFETHDQFASDFKWPDGDQLALVIMAIDETRHVDHGNFIVLLNSDRAFLRLWEHREFVARDPSLSDRANSVISFKDEDGEAFPVPFADTVSRSQAIEALTVWLATGDKISKLSRQ